MKMVIAVLDDLDAEAAMPRLTEKGIGVTRLASTGGFLRRGNTTLMIGVDDDRVDEALEGLRSVLPPPESGEHRRVTAFVVAVDRFEQV